MRPSSRSGQPDRHRGRGDHRRYGFCGSTCTESTAVQTAHGSVTNREGIQPGPILTGIPRDAQMMPVTEDPGNVPVPRGPAGRERARRSSQTVAEACS